MSGRPPRTGWPPRPAQTRTPVACIPLLDSFTRVSMYYALATSSSDGTGDPMLFAALWEKHRAAWDRFVDLTDVAIERIEIPYEGMTLPGYFFRAASGDEPRRTLIFNNGSDGPVTGAWVQGIADALARG